MLLFSDYKPLKNIFNESLTGAWNGAMKKPLNNGGNKRLHLQTMVAHKKP